MKTVYLSERADPRLKNYISECGYDIFNVKGTDLVSGPISSHADIYYCKLGCGDDAPVFCGEKSSGRLSSDNGAVSGRYTTSLP